MSDLRQVGIIDSTFQLLTVDQLIADGVLHRPMDGNHGEQHPKVSDYVSEGIPFIMANDIANGRIDYENCNFITMKQADALRKGLSKPGDVLVTHKATIGRTALVGEEASPYIMLTPQVTYYRIKNLNVLSNRYLRHYFDCELFQKTLSIWAGAGSTRAYLGITGQRKLPIVVPPLCKQLKIAAILAAYDDLIEVNKRRIALLEKMAEELYREWFVRLRFPGYQNTRFVKGVPEGWNIYKFSDICKFTKGRTPTQLADAPLDDYMPYVNAAYLRGQPPEYAKRDRQSVLCESGDVLMLMDGSNSGLVFRALPGIVASTFARIKTDKKYQNFIFEYLKASQESIVSNNTGSAVPHANKEFIDRLIIFVPQEDQLLAGFNEHYHAIHSQRTTLYKQNEILTKTRDLLLPRLISGKLSVEDMNIQFPPSMLGEADGGDDQAA